jgi:hypothetical protein
MARTSAGTLIAIGAAPATYDSGGFAAVPDYTTIGEITDAGEYGKVFNLVTHNPLATRQTKKFKGSFNNGSITLQLAQDEVDVGQVAATAAVDSDDSFSIRVTKQNGAIDYFTAQVMSFTDTIGSVDSIEGGSIQLEIDNDIIKVAAP